MIDSKEASAALADIDDIVQRVKQSRIYDLASQMMIMWGVLVFVANIAGSFAISAANQAATGVRSFDIRVLLAFLMFVAFGFLCAHVLGHFTPRQQGTFWTIYFMLFYALAGLWFGYAFVVIALGITALTLVGYFFVTGDAFLPWMAVVNGAGLIVGGLWMRRS
jgi:hypothetical protein